MVEKIPESWSFCSLGEALFVNPKADKNWIAEETSVSFVPMPAVDAESGRIDVSETKSFCEVKKGYTAFLERDVLFAKITPCMENGKMAVVPRLMNGLGFGSTEFHVLRTPQSLLPEYVYYFVSSKWFRVEAEHNMTGAVGQRRVPTTYLESAQFPLPPHNEQKRIVAKIEELFSELDNGIAALKTVREQLKVYRQAVLKQAFEGKLTATWREENADKLEPPEQLLARIQQEREARYQQQLAEWKVAVKEWEAQGKYGKKPGKPKEPTQLTLNNSDLPQGWLSVSLDCLLTIDKKPMTTGPFGTALKKSEHQSEGIPVLGIENIGNGKFVPGNKIFVTAEKSEELSSFKVHPGEIVISRSGTVGEICEVPRDVTNALISTNLLRVALDNTVVMSPYFVLMFQGGGVKSQVKDLCKGSSREFLNQSILNSIRYPLCGIEEQNVLLEYLEETFSNIERQEKELSWSLQKAETLRQSILKKAFSGQLVPQDPNDEPASALLARIKAEKAAVQAQAKPAAGKRGRKKKEVCQ